MSDIERVHVDIWRNPDQENRVVAGTIPIGDGDIEAVAVDRHSFESHNSEALPYDFWGDAPKKRRRKSS